MIIGKYYFKKNIKLIVGSGGFSQKGFISSDIDWLDITNWWHWFRSFRPGSINKIVAEHVFEHLSKKQIITALGLINIFLKKGGFIRIAIPDKNRKDVKYVNSVKPPVDGHKTYMNLDDIGSILIKAGFKVRALEYFNKKGRFVHRRWNDNDGIIRRSYKHDKQTVFKRGDLYYTSLIVDAVKL